MIKQFMMLSAAVAVSWTLCGQSSTMDKMTDWEKNADVTVEGKVFSSGKKTIFCGKPFVVDFNKSYTITFSASAMSPSFGKSVVAAGFIGISAKGKQIVSYQVGAIPETITEVIEPVKYRSKVIKVKDGSKFRKMINSCIVQHAKADLSDLPNLNHVANGIKNVVKKDGYWEIHTNSVCYRSIKKGTLIRQQTFVYPDGHCIMATGKKTVDSKWQTFSGTVKGKSGYTWDNNKWPIGTVKAKPFVIFNINKANVDTMIKDVKVTVK